MLWLKTLRLIGGTALALPGLISISIAVSVSVGAGETSLLPATVHFDRDIRPIFSDTCFKCHGPDEKQRKAKLRLDLESEAVAERNGKFPIVKGSSARSEAYRRMVTTNADDHMPPLESNKVLSQHQIELVRRWIDQGAKYETHWAFTTPTRPALPAVKHKSWPRNRIDDFILARLEAEGLKPSPEADKATLIRRLSLDLTGLPPTLAEVNAFLADKTPQAYEKLVDRLLASPAYGEKMTMSWLDVARYADSHGYQGDFERSMWHWRDWVIAAFNQNMPFDEFTIEQLAGDLLPHPTRDQRIATGFNRNHRINAEGGIIPEEWRVETIVDRVETTSAVWLGLTMGCCRCHDHKYDPITQKEFYRFFAFFNNINETGTGTDGVLNTPPVLPLPNPEQEKKLAELPVSIKEWEQRLEGPLPEVDPQQAEWERTALLDPPIDWKVLALKNLGATNGSTLTPQADGSVLAGGKVPEKEICTFTAHTELNGITAFRLEALSGPSPGGKGPDASESGDFVLTQFGVNSLGASNTLVPVVFQSAVADFVAKDYSIAKVIDGKNDPAGWSVAPETGKAHVAIFEAKTPVGQTNGTELTFTLAFRSPHPGHDALGRFRLAATTQSKPAGSLALPQSIRAILALSPAARDSEQAKELRTFYRAEISDEGKGLHQRLAGLRKSLSDLEAALPTTMVMEELPKPREAFVLIRGQYDKHGEAVSPGVPAFLPPLPAGAPENRLGLAEWIVSTNNPLTARVAVNRYWEKFFGVGIVKTTENLGSQAEWPSHPELLDWLAVEFMRPTASSSAHAWDMKAIQKLIVMSATYRQSSRVTPRLEERDPENRLLARGPRFRLQAETVRDNALAIAGLLVDKVGGPPVRPYQPEAIWDEVNFFGNLHHYKHDTDGNEYRRSLYTIWKRTTPPPGMVLFDMPSREACTVKRSRTDTPLQALALLNDVTYVEAARVLAEHMLKEGGAAPASRIAYAFRAALARAPNRSEARILADGMERRLATFRAHPEAAAKLVDVGDAQRDETLEAAELAAYTTTASIILNLDETITKE